MKRITESQLNKLAKKIVREADYGDIKNYMFFSNLEQIVRQGQQLLSLDPMEIEDILTNGHDWADDHIAVAKENLDQVFDFMMNETQFARTLTNRHSDEEEDMVMMEGRKKAGTKICARGKTAAKAKYRVYPSAYANGYGIQVCQGRQPDVNGKKRCSPPYC
jgi:hypothetical protein